MSPVYFLVIADLHSSSNSSSLRAELEIIALMYHYCDNDLGGHLKDVGRIVHIVWKLGASPLSARLHGNESPGFVKLSVWIVDKNSGGLHLQNHLKTEVLDSPPLFKDGFSNLTWMVFLTPFSNQ